MPQIIIETTDQELATLTLAAQIRGTLKPDGTPDWVAFYTPWHNDAYGQVQRTAGTMIADDPALSAQLMAMLQAKLAPAPAPEPTPAEPTTQTTTTEEP